MRERERVYRGIKSCGLAPVQTERNQSPPPRAGLYYFKQTSLGEIYGPTVSLTSCLVHITIANHEDLRSLYSHVRTL
jgi:hypothetical protein